MKLIKSDVEIEKSWKKRVECGDIVATENEIKRNKDRMEDLNRLIIRINKTRIYKIIAANAIRRRQMACL